MSVVIRLAGLAPGTGLAQQDKAVNVQEEDVDIQRTNCFINVREDSATLNNGIKQQRPERKGSRCASIRPVPALLKR